ncbi:hypothetical protein GGR56DRAFT_417241 [Xylariaceae sp. FL0804]|nr:hypothetical protein GGR56DRAFT_417241 [Xylariaceae sp. FL0804]
MQSVPSLIGSGTAVAAATTGLVFGQLPEGQPPPPTPKPKAHSRQSVPEQEFASPYASRPPTTSSAAPAPSTDESGTADAQQLPSHTAAAAATPPRILHRSSHAQIASAKSATARHHLARQGEFAPTAPIAEDPRDSSSSNGSWMRRLSIRPRSQHESLRSSVGPDSPSIFSFGSAAPMIPGDSPPQLPRNKLVKRASAIQGGDPSSLVQRGSRQQMTLRRPATSHQRSATLQQQLHPESLPPLPMISYEQPHRPRSQTLDVPPAKPALDTAGYEPPSWKSFWHARVSRSAVKTSHLRSSDNSAAPSAKRICTEQGPQQRVYLVTPNAVVANAPYQSPAGKTRPSQNGAENNMCLEESHQTFQTPRASENPPTSEQPQAMPENTPPKQPRRSISMHFSSPTSWKSKTGSIRRRKRGETMGSGKRQVSAPVIKDSGATALGNQPGSENAAEEAETSHAEAELAAIFRPPPTHRNVSAPLPPLPPLSSFQLDTAQVSPLSPTFVGRGDEPAIDSTAVARVISDSSHARTLERASTVGSSEYHRGFTSGDDDDTTDTPFDSFRTTGSGKRNLDSPLESMFDESPPSTAGNNNKPKRLSIQEILGPAFDGGNKIMEEEENLPTPVRSTYANVQARYPENVDDDQDSVRHPTSPGFVLHTGYSRLSFDDDDDLDWTREDDIEFYNHLSPPSSMNSRGGSPSLRMALGGSTNGNGRPEVHFDTSSERPRSTVFDWAESTVPDKHEGNAFSHRPKTVHGKQGLDIRGGRAASRKGPAAAHIRSKSVPNVPDPAENSKSIPKFGTWGLGQKKASEDWDDDFDFEEGDMTSSLGKRTENRISMHVPESIQATQPTVKAHSGQIRELSLLVNDLKRLCRLGREMNIMNSSAAGLWHEAEGIISLASPDDDTTEADGKQFADDFGPPLADIRFIDQGFDGASLDANDSQRHAVVRERTAGRRRSVFSPEDDIFGNWDQTDDESVAARPRTPQNQIQNALGRASVDSSATELTKSDFEVKAERTKGKLNFDTNSLKELVKRASDLRDGLSDLVRKADRITNSPARTPKHTRADGSPAFTRVFDEPTSTPSRRVTQSRSSNSVLNGNNVNASPSNGLSQRLQMMTVN